MTKSKIIYAEIRYRDEVVRLYPDDRKHYLDLPLFVVYNNWDIALLAYDHEQTDTVHIRMDDDGKITLVCDKRAYTNPHWAIKPITKECRVKKHEHKPFHLKIAFAI